MGSLYILILLGQWTNTSLGPNKGRYQRATVWFKGHHQEEQTGSRGRIWSGDKELEKEWMIEMQSSSRPLGGSGVPHLSTGTTPNVLLEPCIGENVCFNSCQVNLVLTMNLPNRTSQARIFLSPWRLLPIWSNSERIQKLGIKILQTK